MTLPHSFVTGELLTAANLDADEQANAAAAAQAEADAQTGISAAGSLATRLTADESSLATALSAEAALATRLTADEAEIAALQAGGGGGGTATAASRPMVAWDCSSSTILASRLIDHITKLDTGRFQVFLASGTALPADVVIGGVHFPAFAFGGGGWFGTLPSSADDTMTLVSMERSATQSWGQDPASGLYYVIVRVSYQSQSTGSATGADASMASFRLDW